MDIYLIRHGKTEYNRDFKMQGWVDSPLLDQTIEDTKKLAQGLQELGISFDKAYTSDLLRAKRTASLILEEMNQTLDIVEILDLKEADFGEAGGQNVNEVWTSVGVANGYPTRDLFNASVNTMERLRMLKQHPDYSNAEDADDFIKRSMQGLNNVVRKSKAQEQILIVSHTLNIIAILSELGMKDVNESHVSNLSITHLQYNDENFEIIETNKKY